MHIRFSDILEEIDLEYGENFTLFLNLNTITQADFGTVSILVYYIAP